VSQRSILAVELCLSLDPASGLQPLLKRVLTENTQALNFQQKWNMYRQACTALIEHQQLWTSGCWDFFDDDTRARSDFNMWVHGMVSEEGARRQPSGSPEPYRGEPRYLTFTIACLLVNGTHCERQLAAVCNISEAFLWHRATFARVLGGMQYLNFASVEADTMYLIPGDIGWGLTAEDLKAPKFEYLRPIV
jgi:hypothetical protein